MTDNETMKALECCLYGEDCKRCPLEKLDADDCECLLLKNAIGLIKNRQEMIDSLHDRNDMLVTKNDRLKSEIEQQAAKNEELKMKWMYYMDRYHERAKTEQRMREEAIKEFAERLKRRTYRMDVGDKVVFVADVDNLAKEMTEER